MSPAEQTIHATCIAIGARAVLIAGPSGAGKSDLALRLIDRGAALVCDDYTLLRVEDGRLQAFAPARLAGLIEVRGIGIIDLPHRDGVEVALIVELGGPVERLPEEGAKREIAGIALPALPLAGFEASAAIKVELALRRLAGERA